MMNLFCRTLLLSLLIAGRVFSCQAQPYYFKHYQVDEGLVHNSVSAILQDSKGLIWIGTRGGLNCFDGYTFKSIKNKKERLGNIGNNIITALAEDKKGMLWIGTGKGLYKYDPYKEVITLLESAPQGYIRSLLIDEEDNLWVLAETSLYHYNQQNKKIKPLNVSGNCAAIDRNKNIWVGNYRGEATIYSPSAHTVRSIQLLDKNIPENLRSVDKIFPLDDGRILIGSFKQGLKIYDTRTDKLYPTVLSDRKGENIYVRDITAAGNGEYWVATESGIYIYNLAANTSHNIRKRTGDPYSLADNAVYTVCKDNRGGMWVGTFFGGLNYYSKDNARFEKYYPQLGVNSISGNAVREIQPDHKGNLWIGTEDAGINKLDLKTGNFTNYTASGEKNALSYPNVHGLLPIGNDLLIGPFFHGMDVMDTRTGKITDHFKFIGGKDDHQSDFVISILLTRDSTILIGTAYGSSGLFTYDRKKKSFNRIKEIPFDSYVFHIYEDDRGNIWTASVSQGAFYYNPKTGKSGNIHFSDKAKGKYGNEVAVHNIFQDSNHNMWFATAGGGLVKSDRDLKTIKRFTTETGLLSNVIFSILEDDSKHLWVSTLRGLICLDLETEKFKTYTQSNGLITDQFNFNSAYKSPDGKLYFGSVKGMIAFYPSEFTKLEPSPPIYITGFQINNKEIVPGGGTFNKSIFYTDTITLDHDHSSFSIEFAALNYSSPQVTRYKYKMKGLDKQWTYLNSNRKAYFTDLSAGDYTFVVQAESNVGSWTGKQRTLFIKVLPPFWKSNLAYLIYLSLFSITLYLSVRYYHQYLERKNLNKLQLFEHEKEKEIYQAKIEFFTNVAHEIQTPLTLIAGPVELLISKTHELPGVKKSLMMIEKNAKRLTQLTAQLLDFRKTETHQFGLNFVKTDMIRLLKEQVATFKPEATKNGIELRFEVPAADVSAFIDREAMIKICSNLISNAIKYGDSSAVLRMNDLSDADEYFTVWFSNDGKTIPDDFSEKIFEPFFRLKGNNKPGTGIGLSLARSLAELHNGSLHLASNKRNLNIFELRLPVHQKFEFKLSSWKKIK